MCDVINMQVTGSALIELKRLCLANLTVLQQAAEQHSKYLLWLTFKGYE